MHGLLRKLPLRRNHFFEWLKTAVLLIDCGTSTLKSLPSRVFAAPHVHPRLRKCLSRCTLDCGFKTSERPALRGFEAERGPITGTSLYLVLKSNGPHRSKNPPVKFGFSPKTVPANIAKKLPSQRCFKRFSSHLSTSPTNAATFVSRGCGGYTRHPIPESCTQRLTRRNRGCFGWGWYHYSRSVPHVHQHPRAGYQNGKFCRFWGLVGGAPKERRKPSEQRCAYARRCSEASRPRWAA